MKHNSWAIVAVWLAVVFVICAILGAGLLFAGVRAGVFTALSGNGRNSGWWNWRDWIASKSGGSSAYTVDFDTPAPAALYLEMVSVDVRVVTDDTLGGSIKAHFEGKRSGGDSHSIVMLREPDGSIRFKQESRVTIGWFNGGLSGVLTVYVPSSGIESINISNVSGGIEAGGVGALNVFHASAVSGDMKIENIQSGSMSLESVSGKVEASGIDSGKVNASSVSGGISISNTASADASLSSTSGSISYTAPTLDNIAVNASSLSGEIRVGDTRAGHRYNVSGSGGSIGAETVSGDIEIK